LGASPDAFLTLAWGLANPQELTGFNLFDNSRIMDIIEAVDALSGLAQESRLKVFRLLIRAGSDGMAAGDIAVAVGIPKNTLSSHLAILARADLVQARKSRPGPKRRPVHDLRRQSRRDPRAAVVPCGRLLPR
jgi:DNA-binding transcriptional ArsR family regulator